MDANQLQQRIAEAQQLSQQQHQRQQHPQYDDSGHLMVSGYLPPQHAHQAQQYGHPDEWQQQR